MSASSSTARRLSLVVATLVVATIPFLTTVAGAAITSHTISVPAQPDAFVGAGPNIWVASCSGNAVTEINRSADEVVQTLTDPTYGFDCPDALVFDGTNIWVANDLSSALTEFNASTGELVQVLTGPGILNPDALVFDGTNIWVSDNSIVGNVGSFLSEFNASTGAEVRTITTPKNYRFGFGSPNSMALSGSDLWVSDTGNPYAIEFNIHTAAYIRKTTGGPGVSGLEGIAYHSGYFWLSSYNTDTVFEYRASNGRYVRTIRNIVNPHQLIFTGHDLYVVGNSPVDFVREFSPTGAFVRTVTNSNLNLGKGIDAIWFGGSDLWVANYSRGSVTEFVL
jgi:hypothetical protein